MLQFMRPIWCPQNPLGPFLWSCNCYFVKSKHYNKTSVLWFPASHTEDILKSSYSKTHFIHRAEIAPFFFLAESLYSVSGTNWSVFISSQEKPCSMEHVTMWKTWHLFSQILIVWSNLMDTNFGWNLYFFFTKLSISTPQWV